MSVHVDWLLRENFRWHMVFFVHVWGWHAITLQIPVIIFPSSQTLQSFSLVLDEQVHQIKGQRYSVNSKSHNPSSDKKKNMLLSQSDCCLTHDLTKVWTPVKLSVNLHIILILAPASQPLFVISWQLQHNYNVKCVNFRPETILNIGACSIFKVSWCSVISDEDIVCTEVLPFLLPLLSFFSSFHMYVNSTYSVRCTVLNLACILIFSIINRIRFNFSTHYDQTPPVSFQHLLYVSSTYSKLSHCSFDWCVVTFTHVYCTETLYFYNSI